MRAVIAYRRLPCSFLANLHNLAQSQWVAPGRLLFWSRWQAIHSDTLAVKHGISELKVVRHVLAPIYEKTFNRNILSPDVSASGEDELEKHRQSAKEVSSNIEARTTIRRPPGRTSCKRVLHPETSGKVSGRLCYVRVQARTSPLLRLCVVFHDMT